MARAGLAGGAQWEDKREWAEREIREGEEGMELGYNAVKTEMGPQRVKHHVPGVKMGVRPQN